MAAQAPAAAPPGVLPKSPYVGLNPYSELDAPFFFGRDRDRDRIIANLEASRLTVLYGLSGVGKSSVLRAGVAQTLNERARKALESGREADAVVIVVSDWKGDPLATIDKAIRTEVTKVLGGRALVAPTQLLTLAQTVETWAARADCDLLFIFDQFEEFFRDHGTEDGPGTFAVEFPEAVNRRDLRANFVLSTRDDGLAQLDRFKSRLPGIFDNCLRLDRLDTEAAAEAIEEPLEEYNRRLAPGVRPFRVEPALVEAVVSQVRVGQVVLDEARPGIVAPGPIAAAGAVETPYLQLVMARLWDEETRANSRELHLRTLTDLGGAKSIVRTHLNAVLGDLAAADQGVAARIFRYLVTPSGAKIALGLSDLANYTKVPESQIGAVLDRLAKGDNRIVRPVTSLDGVSAPRYEIFHDALAATILDWRRRFLREARERERRRVRRRWTFAMLTVVLVGALIASGLVFTQREKTQAAVNSVTQVSGVVNQISGTATQVAQQGMQAAATRAEALANPLMPAARQTLTGQNANVRSVAFSLDGSLLASSPDNSSGNAAVLIRRRDGSIQATLPHPRGIIITVAWSPDSKMLASASTDGKIRLWTAEGQLVRTLEGHTGSIFGVAWSPDGRTLASTGGNVNAGDPLDSTVRLWDPATGEQLVVLRGHDGSVWSVAWSPDGRVLASASVDGTIRLWDSATRQPLKTLTGHTDRVVSVAWSPDGKTLASASHDRTVRLWNADGTLRRVLLGPDGILLNVAWRDNQALAAASVDRNVWLWDRDGERARVLTGHKDWVYSVAFSPDGRTLASGSRDQTIILWELPAR